MNGPPPQDATLDRRRFLVRMGALAALAPVGVAAMPTEGVAAPVGAAPASGVPPRRLDGGTSRRAQQIREAARARGFGAWRGRTLPVDIEDWTLAEALLAIDAGTLHPRALTEIYLDRIRRLDGVYRAWNVVEADQALAAADERAGWTQGSGLLRGIPLAVKDNYYVGGMLTTANSLIFQDFRPAFDATAITRLRDAGAIVLGKTQMGPLATTRATTPAGETTTVNAWVPGDPLVNPGGSSSGSATAVAAGMAAGGLGTQTGGSITAPAMAQGLTGLKPTMGRVSLHGVIPLSYTRDHPGPIARDALDAALLLQVMAGPDPADPRTLGLPPVPDYVLAAEPVLRGGRPVLRWDTTIGVLPGYLRLAGLPVGEGPALEGPAAEGQARARAEEAARRAMMRTFEQLGARVVEIPFPEGWDVLTGSALNNVRLPERSEPFLDWLRADVRLFGSALPSWINGLLLSGEEYLRGQRARALLLDRVLEEVFEACDVVVQTSPVPFDMMGLPLMAFPIGMDETAGPPRPMGAMFGGAPFGEERLLSLVAAYQTATDWHLRRPPDPDPALVASRPAGPIPWWETVPGPVAPGGGSARGDGRPAGAPVRLDAARAMDLSE